MTPRDLVLATHNRSKGEEMRQILAARFPHLRLLTLVDFPGAPEPDETGTTYAENARIKADSAREFTGLWSVADDAGLEVDALDGAPGLYSRRFAGEETSFPEKAGLILAKLHGLPTEERGARFRVAVALARPGEATEVFEAECEGQIAESASGRGGFGYDPIFYLPERGLTMADLSAEQKHAISHRGKVLAAFSARLAELL